MSDPFAPNPAARYSTPPFSSPSQSSAAPVSGLFAPPSAASMPLVGPGPSHSRTAPSALPSEFGSYNQGGPSASHSTSAARARSSHSPNMMIPLATSADERPINPAQAQRQRHRQSHNPSATLIDPSPPKPEYLTDEYVLHPSVWAWKQANPSRHMIGFGHYVILQTLGEGEFGKVKLGIHTEYGNQVAVKLIKRGSLEDTTRASKVEREIDVLKTLKHPNIVRMHDLVQTDKVIGIVLEYAGGGELFDYILANRYLKDKDAQKLFAQLISGVDYLHKKHIVHRDLKLENLLLDQHRNIIITDFGFANRFGRAQDDLMATSCGSPCYAAPELVVSEGLYVGSAVDIWSCGVILYAMLSGYLPYDDDPDNPDGDNINLLYKYIMSTKLNFPDHLSDSARNLLEIMLVADPDDRCTVGDIMRHPWLIAHRELFSRSVDDLEYLFEQDMYQKSQQAMREHNSRRRVQREARAAKLAIARSQSSMPGSTVSASLLDHQRRARDTKHHSAMPGTTTMPEFLNNAGRRVAPSASTRQSINVPAPIPALAQTSPIMADASILMASSYPQSRPTTNSTAPSQRFGLPTVPRGGHQSDTSSAAAASMTVVDHVAISDKEVYSPPVPTTPEQQQSSRPSLSAGKNRHTIQVEYDEQASYEQSRSGREEKRIAGDSEEVAESGISLAASSTTGSSPSKRVVELQEGDVDMDSASSEQSHTVESFSQAISDGMRTPPPSTPPTSRVLDRLPKEVAVPSTPSPRKIQEGALPPQMSPTTPRAVTMDAEDVLTPRARPVVQADRAHVDTPKSNSQRREPIPTKLATPPRKDGPTPSSRQATAQPDSAQAPPVGRRERYRKGMSLDKFGLAKLLGSNQASSTVDVSRPSPSSRTTAAATQDAENAQKVRRGSMRPKTAEGDGQKDKRNRRKTLQLMVNRSMSQRDNKTSKGPTTPATPGAPLTARDTNAIATPVANITPVSAKAQPSPPVLIQAGAHTGPMQSAAQSVASVVTVNDFASRQPVGEKGQASSSAAKKVMDWFRRKSMARDTLGPHRPDAITSDSTSSFVRIGESPDRPIRAGQNSAGVDTFDAMSSTSSIIPTDEPAAGESTLQTSVPDSVPLPKEPMSEGESRGTLQPAAHTTDDATQAASSSAVDLSPTRRGTLPVPLRSRSHGPNQIQEVTPSIVIPTKVPLRSSPARTFDESKMRVHTGLVDQSALSSKPPKEVMAEVIRVLQELGMDIKKENEFKVRCIRARRRKSGPTIGLGIGSVMGGSNSASPFMLAGPGSVRNERGSALPSTPSGGLLSGAGLKGMLLRRGSSYSSTHPANITRSDSDFLVSPSASSIGFGSPSLTGSPRLHETVYGEHSIDSGDEVKFAVELCRMKNLPGLYSLNIKRLKGGVWSFKFIYQTVLERCETLTH